MKLLFILYSLVFTSMSLSAFHLYLYIPPRVTPTGTLKVAIYKNQKTFLNDKHVYRHHSIPINTHMLKNSIITINLRQLVPGNRYAIALFIDQNKNNKFDRTKILRLPLEPYGFSGNPPIPTYDICQFTYQEDLSLKIKIRTPFK